MFGIGEAMALGTALAWGLAVITFKKSGSRFSPVELNLFKVAIGTVCLLATGLIFSGSALQAWQTWEVLAMVLGGMVGLGIADTLFFKSLNTIGASRAALVECTYSPMIIFFAFVLLNEKIEMIEILGGGLIVLALVVISRQRANPLPPGAFGKGVAFGLAAIMLMAVSIVWVRPIFQARDLIWSTAFRSMGGLGMMLLLHVFRKNPTAILGKMREATTWKYTFPGAFLGSYVCLLLWIGGFKYAPTHVAALLNQTSTFFIVGLAAIFLGEPLTRKKVLSVLMAVAGSVLVLS